MADTAKGIPIGRRRCSLIYPAPLGTTCELLILYFAYLDLIFSAAPLDIIGVAYDTSLVLVEPCPVNDCRL
jgi:hypothetical protein